MCRAAHHFPTVLTCPYICRDLIRVLKWHVDRIIDAEHHEQIQQVLKVKIKHLSAAQMCIAWPSVCVLFYPCIVMNSHFLFFLPLKRLKVGNEYL